MTTRESLILGGALWLWQITDVSAAPYTESIDGDLSNDRLSPTTLALAVGSNRVRGAFGQPDLDYITLTVPGQHVLAAITVGPGNVPGGARSFIAVQAGTQMTVPPDTQNPADLLGYAHVGFGSGDEILSEIGTGFGALGFVPPLAAGSYTFWIQDTAQAVSGMGFDFDFEVQAMVGVSPQKVPMFPWYAVVATTMICARIARRKYI